MSGSTAKGKGKPPTSLYTGVGVTFDQFSRFHAEAFDEFQREQIVAGVTDIDEIHEAWIAKQKPKPPERKMVVWSKSARTPERHAEVLAQFRASTARRKA